MGAMPNEPSMEEILSSIKRIIADEDRHGPRAPRRGSSGGATRAAPADADLDNEILELTEALPDETASLEDEVVPETPAAKPAKTARSEARPARKSEASAAPLAGVAAATVLSDISAKAARDSLANLSKMVVKAEPGQANTLEALVQELLRPMLKDWLDANLPQIVETLVKREIDRISGRV
ncbi:MAG: DUF2497 domain-containing protein [Sphingobium sp.]|nr:DUF2497 domain-containing protein [Sphingobium sp.]